MRKGGHEYGISLPEAQDASVKGMEANTRRFSAESQADIPQH